MRHTETPNPRMGLPNFWGCLMLSCAVLAGCGSYATTQHDTLGGSYRSSRDWTPFTENGEVNVTAPTAEAVRGAMTSSALQLCLAQRERQAELATRHDVRRAQLGQGYVAVVPPQHPSSVTDDYAYCMATAEGLRSGSALRQSVVPIQPNVVPTWGYGGYGGGYGYGQIPFSSTGGAPGVR